MASLQFSGEGHTSKLANHNTPTASNELQQEIIMPATVPFGAESEVAFISGVTNVATVAEISSGAWKGDLPATYGVSVNTAGPAGNESNSFKWGGSALAING